MHKRELALLGEAYGAEIRSAITGEIHVFQSRSKVAKKLCADGLFEEKTLIINGRFPVKITGYQLTELGRMKFCMACENFGE
jgi:hypothetical protein